MALSRVGGSSAAGSSIAIPAHVAGDLIVIWAYRDGSTAIPTKPAAAGTVPSFTTIDGPTGANSCSAICAWAIATGTTETSGTWTNATGMSVEVWSGASSTPIGGHTQSGASVANGANIAIPAITLTDPTGNSAILAFAGWQNVTAWNAAPAGYTQQSQVATECEVLSKNTTTSDGTFNITGTASATGGTRTQQLEIIANLGNRVSQEAIEAIYSLGSANSRLSQEAIEALFSTTAGKSLFSQEAIEVLTDRPGKSIVSQISIEVLETSPLSALPFIPSVTIVYPMSVVHVLNVPFISSNTIVYTPSILSRIDVPFISSNTNVYAPTLTHSVTQIDVPFIPSHTRVFGVYSIYSDVFASGIPGNGGEQFPLKLAPNGSPVNATLVNYVSSTSSIIQLSGDGGIPTSGAFMLIIDDEVLYVVPAGSHLYSVKRRGMSNTTPDSHSPGATVTWSDYYDMAILAGNNIAESFTADIAGSGSQTYPGWLICFDSTQAYIGSLRYPMHVTSFLGVFDAGAGSTGTNRCDAAQPNAECTPATISDDCPAAIGVPSRIALDILVGDVAVVRYENPEASIMILGSRSTSLQSWFGMRRVSNVNVDVTFTDPNGNIVDGSVNGEWDNPLGPGIGPDTGEPTSHDVPYTSVTLPGTDRFFTYGSPHYSDPGWPIGVIAVRQGRKRIPYWRSWDWHNFTYVYSGFDTDATFCQMVINRNGLIYGPLPEVDPPGPQDIDGPDAVWDDGSYQFGSSWYVALYAGHYLVSGPAIGGSGGPFNTDFNSTNIPSVVFTGGTTSPVIIEPVIEGGSGGGISPPPQAAGIVHIDRINFRAFGEGRASEGASGGGTGGSGGIITPTSPRITSLSLTSGPEGTVVIITGTNLTGSTAVKFGGVNAPTFTVTSATSITVTVPVGALTGQVSVTTPTGIIYSTQTFVVTGDPVPPGSTGTLIFEDHFDGSPGSPPDSANWHNVDGLRSMQATYSKASNAYHDGASNMILRVIRESWYGLPFSGANICTYKYGWGWPPPEIKQSWPVPFRYEARVLFPNVDSAWIGCGWNQNVDRNTSQPIYELDCGETISTNRFGMGANQHTWQNGLEVQGASGFMACSDNRLNWHVVAVEARTTGCTYFIDGVPLKTNYGVSGTFGVMLHNEIGDPGFWGFTHPDPADPGPWYMKIDYVRVYAL